MLRKIFLIRYVWACSSYVLIEYDQDMFKPVDFHYAAEVRDLL